MPRKATVKVTRLCGEDDAHIEDINQVYWTACKPSSVVNLPTLLLLS